MKTAAVILFAGLVLQPFKIVAQQIDFAQFYNPNNLAVIILEDLDFGGIIAGDLTVKERALGSGLEGVIEIEGFPFLDVFVSITEISVLTLDGNPCASADCQVDVTLQYAFTNTGIDVFATNYENLATYFIGDTARFQIVRRQSGPPGPPPPPSITGVSLPPVQKAFIYIFGEASASTGVISGSYSNTLTVTIEYI
jgi:hypothetical protein